MACNESAFESKIVMEASHTAVEIKIKTLDSQVYTCRVQKNVSVPDLKEQVAIVTGVPSGSQRLICRGKVLKDEHALSAYEVEDGHTLHLVTRQAPPPSVSTASMEIQSEEQEAHDYTSFHRPGHISHSVLVGTFNIPDRGDVIFPEINRIFSSVLSSLRVGGYSPPILASGNGNSASLQGSANVFNVDQEREEHADHLSEQRVSNQARTGSHQSGSDSIEGLLGLRQESSHVGGMPGVSHVRIVHQIVPNALRTLSQHVDRMEQVFAARNVQEQNLSSSSNTRAHASAQSQSNAQANLLHGDDWNPAAWGSLFRRIQELLVNQAASDLLRYANHLEGEPNLRTDFARGNLFFAGIILEQLGRLLSNLGGTAMAVLMEPSQPGVQSASMAELVPRHPGGETMQHVDNDDVAGNMDIHIHAGLPPFVVARNLLSQATQEGPSLSLNIDDARNSIDDYSAHASDANVNIFMQPPSLGGMQAPASLQEHSMGSARAPESFQDSLLSNRMNGGRGVFYPLLARFQQLNPALFSQEESISIDQTGSEEGSLLRRDIGSGQPDYPSLSVLQAVIQNQVDQAVSNGEVGFVAREQWEPAPSLNLEARDSHPETDTGFGYRSSVEHGYETSAPGSSYVCQDLVRPLLHVLEVSPPTVPSEQEPPIPIPDQGPSDQGMLGKADAETSLQLKCTGQASLDVEWSNRVLKDGSSLSNKSVEDGKIFGQSEGPEGTSKGFCAEELQPFLCRTRLGQESQDFRKTDDVNTTASKGTVLQDFLSTLAFRNEERSNQGLDSTKDPPVLENTENQEFGLGCSGSNAICVTPLLSPHCITESLKQKGMLEICLDPLRASGLESSENDAHRLEDNRFCLHDNRSRDDIKGLQQFFPVAHIPNSGCRSPSLHLNELENVEAMSLDSGRLLKLQVQEFSTATALADKDPEDLKRHVTDPSFEGLPAIKRQKIL